MNLAQYICAKEGLDPDTHIRLTINDPALMTPDLELWLGEVAAVLETEYRRSGMDVRIHGPGDRQDGVGGQAS